MQCWKCGGQTVGGVCTLCGGRERDRIPAATPAGRALRYVYDKFGAKRTLTEDGLLARCLTDVLPDEIELRRALTAAFAAGAGREFYAVLETNQPLTEATFQGLVRVLRAAELTEEDARAVLVSLWDMAGCGAPQNREPPVLPHPSHPTTPQVPPERSMREVPREVPQERPREIAQRPAPVQTSQVLASLGNVVLADATHGINAMKSNGRSGMLFLRADGVAMHYYERKIGISKNRAWNQAPDIFIPVQAIDRVIIHDSGLTYDFTLALKDGVRFQAISSTYAYNRKDAKRWVTLLQEQLARAR